MNFIACSKWESSRLVVGASIDRATSIVRVQGPVRTNDHTLPQPDLSILPRRWAGYPTQHPPARQAYLLIEVADATLLADSTIKAGLYARSNVLEYWIVDLTADEVVVHRDPENGTYASIERRQGDTLRQVAALPAITMAVSSIFECIVRCAPSRDVRCAPSRDASRPLAAWRSRPARNYVPHHPGLLRPSGLAMTRGMGQSPGGLISDVLAAVDVDFRAVHIRS